MIRTRSCILLLIICSVLSINVLVQGKSHTRTISYEVRVPYSHCGLYWREKWCIFIFCKYHWITECYIRYRSETRSYTVCLDGWTGGDCDIPICSKGCLPGYECVEPDKCKCLLDGGTCTSVPCSKEKSCFPGTCTSYGSCRCPQTVGGDDCEIIKQTPDIEVCEVSIQVGDRIVSEATCAYQGQLLPEVMVNSLNWKQINVRMESKASDMSFPNSRGLHHVKFPLKYGVAKAGFEVSKNGNKMTTKICGISHNYPQMYYKCTESEFVNALKLEHGDNITIKAFASLGGSKEGTNIVGNEFSFFQKVIFTGREMGRQITFKVDIKPPTHCSRSEPGERCLYFPIQLKRDVTSDLEIQPQFNGWDDKDSGVTHYHVKVYFMQLSSDDFFESAGKPFVDRIIKPDDPDFDNFVFNCKKPGVHSIELSVYDRANNTAKARNIFLYTGSNELKVDPDNPIMISNAKQNKKTGDYWITDEKFHRGYKILRISWNNHFVSNARFSKEWASPVHPWGGEGFDDVPLKQEGAFVGLRTIYRMTELKNGIMNYSLAYYVDEKDGGIADNYTNEDLLSSTKLEEEIDIETSKLGTTIGIKLSAYDVAGGQKETKLKVRIDTTVPQLKNWTLLQNNPDIYTSKVSLLITDKESGIDKISFDLVQVLDGTNEVVIKSGEAKIITRSPPQLESDRKKREALEGPCNVGDKDCYCTPYRSCFTVNQFITIDHCWIDRQVKAKNKIAIDFEVLNQAGIGSGSKRLELNGLDELHCRPEFKLTGAQLFGVVFCTLVGLVLISAVLALLVRIYVFKKPPPSKMLFAFRDRLRRQAAQSMETSNDLYISSDDYSSKTPGKSSASYNKNEKVKLIDEKSSIKFISEDCVQINDEINKGSAMIISKGFFTDGTTKLPVAIKSLKNGASQKVISIMNSKAEGLFTFPFHENVVKVFGLIKSNNGHMIVMEYCDLTLKSWLTKLSDISPDALDDILSFAINISRAVQHLHKHEIIHKRLGVRNVLLVKQFNQYVAKLIGFEVTNKGDDDDKTSVPIKWLAPETLSTISKKCPNYSKKSDAWSFGITLWEMFTLGKQQPYPEVGSNEAKVKIISGKIMDCPEECPPDLYKKVMQPCWATNPKERPTFVEISELIENFKKGEDGAQAGYYAQEDRSEINKSNVYYTDGS